MYQALIIFHVLVAVSIIALVLLQQGRGADAGAAFGSGASGSVFGAAGSASFLTRTTAVLATLFFATSLMLAILGDTRDSDKGFMDEPTVETPQLDLPPGQDLLDGTGVSDLPAIVDKDSEAEGDLPSDATLPSSVELEETVEIIDIPVGEPQNPSADAQ